MPLLDFSDGKLNVVISRWVKIQKWRKVMTEFGPRDY